MPHQKKAQSNLSKTPLITEESSFFHPSPLGTLKFTFQNSALVKVQFHTDNIPSHAQACPLAAELTDYFRNPQHVFQVECHLQGTPFQIKVWQALRAIPSGQTLTYQALAEKLQTGARAVGNACRANPIPVIIPCHRVVAKKHVGGYAGATDGRLLTIKKWLLAHEQCDKTFSDSDSSA